MEPDEKSSSRGATGARLEIGPGVHVAESALRFAYSRSSGPGGQNVNKVNTKAELWVQLDAIEGMGERAIARLRQSAGRRLTLGGDIHIAADVERSQESNREAALHRLRILIIEALHEAKPRRKTKVSRGAKKRRLDSKRRRGAVKALRKETGD